MLSRRALPSITAAVLAALSTSAANGAAARFAIVDDIGPNEIGETTSFYVDSALLATVTLDPTHREAVVSGTVADDTVPHRYALCGTVTVRRADGIAETREVDASGTLRDVAARRFQAFGSADYTFFYLADAAPGRIPTEPSREASPLCHPPLS